MQLRLLLSALIILPRILPAADVTYQRILNAAQEPGNWLTYSGTYSSLHHSTLDQINLKNVRNLRTKWVHQVRSLSKFENTPLVVDGVMYITSPPNDVIALDIATGRPFWIYRRALPEPINVCCGRVNRGLAILGSRLFMGTVDGFLIALDAKSGNLLWEVEVADRRTGHSLTAAPLALKDKIITGVAGGEYGVRGFLDAYDPETGHRIWRFFTIPAPGESGSQTWTGDAWKTGGAPTWITGSYDPSSTSSTGVPVTPHPTGTETFAPGTTYTPHPWLHSTRTPVSKVVLSVYAA